ncbi:MULTISPECIES: Type 1 glutamine amidotransferase-like domain-containing protein [Vagococcus]|uniref:Alpha-aspartyl dipeptidase Peptidase E n=1 Tax=Vagococcus fluvialis bH819 TaxID=1255619 RepID=A0A1X6WLX6_9ENTE|nr:MULTISPECIES: Type 1 glutamine amidotransferase-like domain-containing protein [Vagococcus]SLM85334.1 Alpha-aspartyl dipeptidase Peptidase E [Vagococcus fluvialis bH819]HCM89372.1 peptidase S51 [Vagococcus sp.]
MKQLFLCSSFQDSYQKLENFSTNKLTGSQVAFFNTASQVEEYSEYVDQSFNLLKELGMIPFVVNIESTTLEEVIVSADIIFVAGGNTFYLLQELRKSNADQLIINHINKGKLYIGESAGSVIMSPDINYIQCMDEPEKAPNLKRTDGLHVINTYPVPHAETDYLGEAALKIQDIYQDRLELVILRDDDVMIYSDVSPLEP